MSYLIIMDAASALATGVAVAAPLIAYAAGSLVWRWSSK